MTPATPCPWQPDSCSGCALYGVGRGFVLDVGDPRAARIAIVLETPALEEINFGVWPPPGPRKRYVLGEMREAQEEVRRRRARYPDIPPKLLARGVPVVGRTGAILNFRLLEQAGLRRGDVFIGNTLRCLPPRNKQGANWPTGDARHVAAAHCRRYDRWDEFSPTIAVLSIHPASILREVTPELLIVEDLRKAKEFADAGERVLVVMGGKAAEVFLGYGSNISRWRGHYERVDNDYLTRRGERLMIRAEKARRTGMPKVKKKTKAETAMETLATTIVNNLIGMGLMQSDGPEAFNQAVGVVVASLTPPPRSKKPAKDATEAAQ